MNHFFMKEPGRLRCVAPLFGLTALVALLGFLWLTPAAHAEAPSTLAAGTSHTCFLKNDGNVICWGAGATSAFAHPNFGQSVPLPGPFVLGLVDGAHYTAYFRFK